MHEAHASAPRTRSRKEARGKETEAKRGHDEKVRRLHSARRAVRSLDENVFTVLLRAADVGVSDRDWHQMLFLRTFWN